MPRIYLSPPHIGQEERDAINDALDSNWIAPVGPKIEAFEAAVAEVCGRRFGVALSSGTAGLHLSLLLAGVQPGDDVVVSTLTFVASANAVRYVGARPVFIDSERASWNLDPELLEEYLRDAARSGRLPAAVLSVDIYGQCASYDRIAATCKGHGVPLIEDAAEALGASHRGQPAGAFGNAAVVSFNGNKIITCSGGGMFLTDRADWAERARYLATQAREPAPHYEHTTVGYNYRLSNILAALGLAQLRRLPERVARRRQHNAYYRAALGERPGVTFMSEAPGAHSTFWLTAFTLDPSLGPSREDLRLRLEAEDIEARPVWKPMHQQRLFEGCQVVGGEVADDLFANGLCLPSGSSLTDAERSRVVAVIEEVLDR